MALGARSIVRVHNDGGPEKANRRDGKFLGSVTLFVVELSKTSIYNTHLRPPALREDLVHLPGMLPQSYIPQLP